MSVLCYIEGVMFGTLWMGERVASRVRIDIPQHLPLIKAIQECVDRADDFQPGSKRFDKHSDVVFERRTFEQHGYRSISIRKQWRVPFSMAPSLAKFIEIPRGVH